MENKICTNCNRELPCNTDYYFMKLGKLNNRCKECCGRKFTNKLTHIPKDGHIFCKKCDRELPHTYQYFPEDKSCKNGIRYVCRECNPSYGRFLNDGEEPHRGWTKEEIMLLKENYANYMNAELIELFFPTRTVRSIESQASILCCSGKSKETIERQHKFQSEILKSYGNTFERTQEWKNKISKSNKEYYKTHNGVNLGKTFSKKHCQNISKAKKMAGNWKGFDNPRHKNPLNGAANGRWKGGIIDTYRELRSDTKDWQQESMKFCNYHCIITNGEFDNIHHTTPFRKIVDACFYDTKLEVKEKVCDYLENDFSLLRNRLKELHIYYGFGACICKKVHKLFHDNYGYINFTPYDFLDFIYRIDCGEFDEWFKNNNLIVDINYEYINYLESILLNLKSA